PSGQSLTLAPTTVLNTPVVNQGTLNLSGTLASTLDNQGLLRVQSNAAVNGALTTSAASTIRTIANTTFGTASLAVANGFTNLGVIELADSAGFTCCYGSGLVVNTGTLVNASGATITATASQANSGRQLTAALDNQGTL